MGEGCPARDRKGALDDAIIVIFNRRSNNRRKELCFRYACEVVVYDEEVVTFTCLSDLYVLFLYKIIPQ